ncbi:MAG: glycoside hydrolase family 66 protein [Anaerolineae bacterium]
MLLDVYPAKAFYRPGETVRLVVRLADPAQLGVQIVASVSFLAEEVARLTCTASLTAEDTAAVDLVWVPPSVAPRGYGVDVQVLDGHGLALATASTAFDVLEHWTQAPRYGFLTDYAPGRSNVDETMQWLTRHHINGLQFYDWMYRHDQFLPPEDLFDDPLGRQLSLATVRHLIDAAHSRGIAALPYTAVYAASLPFFELHPDWALFDADGKPIPFGDRFLMIMNPAPHSPWTQHLLNQFSAVLQETAFDGIHLDQYGDPKVAYDAGGNRVDLAQALPDLVDATVKTAVKVRPGAAVLFNCVGNWPIEGSARSQQDLNYIEVWPPNTLFKDLYSLIVEAQALSGGKPVVLAAYIDPARARNVRLADAVILASGGTHIELGEPGAMLADPYFPNYGRMSDDLSTVIRRYYDFAVRYENILALDTRDATPAFEGRVAVEGLNTDAERLYNKVWPIVREGADAIGLSLINLLELDSPEWVGALTTGPLVQRDLLVRVSTGRPVRRVWWATADGDSPAAQDLEFSTETSGDCPCVSFRVPWLAYWHLIVLELGRGSQEIP